MSSHLDDLFSLARPHLELEVNRMLTTVTWEDLHDEEVVVLATVLRPIFERRHPQDWPAPDLQVINGGAVDTMDERAQR